MVRACCVLNCTSTGTMPSHTFPKNPEMRDKWMANLVLKPHKEDDICKLRVCYKHFKETDYTGSCTLRRLVRAAVPFMEICERICEEETNTVEHSVEHEQNTQQETMTVLQENIEQLQIDMEKLCEQQEEHQENVQIDMRKLCEQQEKHQENVQKDITKLFQMQTQDHDQLQEIVKELGSLRAQIEQNSQARRLNLAEVTRKKNLSSVARKLYENNVKLQAQRRRMKRVIKKMKEQNVNNINNKITLDKGQDDNKTRKIREDFINMMLRNNDVSPQARRYTIEDKIFCLGIYRRSRSSYNYISKYLLCPSYNTLNIQLNRISIDTECNNVIRKYLTSIAKKMDPKDLYIVLAWDEMAIQPAVKYEIKSDKIVGFEDWGMRRTRRFADHAIAFYIRCLASGNKMPIGYGFCNSATTSIQLSRCIKEWLQHLQKCGFKTVATVCDQGGPNIAAINTLIAETRAQHLKHNKTLPIENTFYVGHDCIVPLYDYVHLQKGVRNNLLTKDLLLNKDAEYSEREGQCASWDDITTAYAIDQKCFQHRRKMKKLTDSHIRPNLIPKMKVKFAVQVLSHTVADFIDMILTLNKDGVVQTNNETMHLSKNAAATAEALFFFDSLFDSFNGNSEQGLSSIITQNSGHLKFWQEALHKLRKMEYVEKKSYKSLTKNKPKCLVNWRQTIQGAKCLWQMLQACGFTSLNLKYLNQDHVENFFSQIRNHGHQNTNPTPYLFSTSFKALLTCNLTSKHSISANCTVDKESFLPLLALIRTEEIESLEENEINVECDEAAVPDKSDESHTLYIDTRKIINIVKKKSKMECAECIAIMENEKTTQMLDYAMNIAENRFSDFCYETKVKYKLVQIFRKTAFSTKYFHCTDVQNTILSIHQETR
ncbi:uncharacterized protein LOC143906696 [Temnothorax americanus]|uniref:uncharacterized protein LOC143906696 n=1 Tax=Temnothorax americanus TaxID=1964332 RepID=UPI0040678881